MVEKYIYELGKHEGKNKSKEKKQLFLYLILNTTDEELETYLDTMKPELAREFEEYMKSIYLNNELLMAAYEMDKES